MKLMAATAALACSTLSNQAQAAKVFTIAGASTGSVQVDLPYPFPTNSSGSHTINLVLKFQQPFTGFIEFGGDYTWYDTKSWFGDANELPYGGSGSVSGTKSLTIVNQLRSGWQNGIHYTYMPRPAYLTMAPDNEQTSFDYAATGFYAVPEPATWALMICGFGLVGGAMRRRSAKGCRGSLPGADSVYPAEITGA